MADEEIITNVITTLDKCLQEGNFNFQLIANKLPSIVELGSFVRYRIENPYLNQSGNFNHLMALLGSKVEELSNNFCSKYNNLKISIEEQSSLLYFVGVAFTLTKFMEDTMVEPCHQSYAIFQDNTKKERDPPLKRGLELIDILEGESIIPVKNNDKFGKWRRVIEALLTLFLFLEAYNTGVTWEKDINKTNHLKDRIKKYLKKIDELRNYTEKMQSISKKLEQVFIQTPELMNKGPENNELLSRLLRNEVKYDDFKKSFEISQNKLTTFENQTLGADNFGYVVKGVLFHNGKQLNVAVKRSRNPDSKIDQELFIAELTVMCAIPKHPNILSLLGGITTHPVQIVMEYVEGRDLLRLLRLDEVRNNFKDLLIRSDGQAEKFRDIEFPIKNDLLAFNTFDLISISYQIANGMKHLASLPCVHRDLALRNILISVNKTIRIADFGLARKHKKDYYRPEDPFKVAPAIYWTAPEAMLDDKFTERSDVWSYGVCLYELFTLGMTPTVDGQALYLSDKLLPMPDYCPSKIYKHMTTYWDKDPDLRPNFSGCVDLMRSVLKSCGYQIYEKVEEKFQEVKRMQDELLTYV